MIEGGFPLHGKVTPSGNKNETLPLLAASLLTDERIVLRNVPRIRDVSTMLGLLAGLGVDIEEVGPHEVALRARQIARTHLDPTLCREIRASILLAGPMLACCGQVELPPPGGDVIGRRRVDTHLSALGALGAEIEMDGGYKMRTAGLRGQDIFLDEASVTGTENVIMAACRAQGTTIIRNAACEPHVQNLCHFLNALGARIEGIGTNELTIHGVERLSGGEWEITSDFIEVGSFIGLAAVTGSELLIKKAVPEHLRMTRLMLGRLGVHVEVQGENIFVPSHQHLQVVPDAGGAIPKIDDGIWPAFPTDLMSIAVVVATQSAGTVIIHEKMYEGRLYFVDKLISMGARIILCDPYRAVVVGPAQLHGAPLESPDIRAGIALLIAALCAQGQSVIGNIGQIDRGYERIEEKLQALGAHIERVRG
ncbi:MAG TPA: UDP-N-acetylglucosamine 1-carboxyvinyltransferase [Anaerolineae bacterium]|nr:UDP-N-acetylglucosamine 1-carboxyvinyltransferase [Anaerolineae bacterium]